MARDLYEVLGAEPGASKEELAAAYKKAVLRVHPDRNPGDKDASRKIVEVNQAYSVLSDDDKRRVYDRQRAPRPSPMDEINDIFSRHYGFKWDQSATEPQRGKDVDMTLQLTLKEAVLGTVKAIKSRTGPECVCEQCEGGRCTPGTGRAPCTSCAGTGYNLYPGSFRGSRVPCRSCRGFGDIPFHPCRICQGSGKRRSEKEFHLRIPCGITADQKLRLAGQGETGPNGMSGDMIVSLEIAEDPQFVRKGQDLFTSTRVPFHAAVGRTTFQVVGIDGKRHDVKMAEEIKSGDTTVSIPGAGVPSMTGRAGRLHAVLHVDMPFPKTARANMLLNELVHEMSSAKPNIPSSDDRDEEDYRWKVIREDIME